MEERLNKVLAASGIASRRGADSLIADGRVKVNGIVAPPTGGMIEPTDKIEVDGKPLPTPSRVTYILNKPRGVVSTRVAQSQDSVVTDLVPTSPPVYPVGRLDKESEGLILMSNDGALTDKLTHPRYKHRKEYTVYGHSANAFKPRKLEEVFLKGIPLEDGLAKADSITIREENHGILVLVITVHEGRSHLIRRMCAATGIHVQRLIRTRMSNLKLGALQPGEWRALTPAELALLA